MGKGKGKIEMQVLLDTIYHNTNAVFLLEFDKVALTTIEGTTCYQHAPCHRFSAMQHPN
jgi:hypothetical protein